MDTKELYRALEIAKAAVVEAGAELRRHFGVVEAELKDDNTAVTELDRKTEKFLAERLRVFDPSIGFRGEEFGIHTDADTTWLVDPIDGTHHFIHGIPFCTTMVALIESGEVVMSMIYDFVREETYWAIKGEGAYKETKNASTKERLQVSKRTLRHGLITWETKLGKAENQPRYFQMQEQTFNIQLVCCGYEFILILSGKMEGRIAVDPWGHDWDFAPGSLLVAEAGGIVVNIGSDHYDYKNHNYIMANPVVYKELTEGPNALF